MRTDVTVQHLGPPNMHGEGQVVSETVLRGVIVAPGGSNESDLRGETVTTDLTVYAAPDAAVSASDRVAVRGQAYEVIGVPQLWEDPFSGERVGTEIRLRRVTG